MGSFVDVSLDRKSSIETEPRTLNFNQIQDARQAALYVVENKSLEEASTIFTEGLNPCKTVERKREKDIKESSGDGESGSNDEDQVLAAPGSMHLGRDIASAPF
ncbi:hypothetical protein FRX31_014635 [Thalictrum thalictroides]|uniref:Uncharacterized protein n=1 Tax=Thalictrum thalictroides TaxID=46969 RepID=A0A7J6WGM4_THATH|nr:hypothetical protein FRX31_014635 [Thalictrum thalictroides]